MPISVLNIARNSIKFSTINILAAIIALPVGIYVATVVSPEEYGVYGFLGLWLTYATLIRPGFTISGYREVPVLLGKGEDDKALRVQNISITSDMLYSVLPVIIILGASFFYDKPLMKYGLILTAVIYASTQLVNYWNSVNFIRQNFNIVAKGKFIATIVAPVVTVASVYWLKVYALLAAPICVALITGIYYWKWGPIHFRFTFDWKETTRLMKTGVILQAGTLVYWAFRLVDKTIIAANLPMEQLGLYTFAMGLVMMILTIPADFTNVLQPIIYKELGKVRNVYEGFRDIRRVLVFLALGTAILIPLAQLAFYLVVSLITTKYTASIPVFNVLSYNIYLAAIVPAANIILTSSIVNKQKLCLFVDLIGLALSIAFCLLVIKWGYGIIGVAWVMIGCQCLVTLIVYFLARSYLCRSNMDYFKLLITILMPFLLTIPFFLIHSHLNETITNIWAFTGISLAIQAVLWSLVIGIFYRNYLSLNDIKYMMNEINVTIKGRLSGKTGGTPG